MQFARTTTGQTVPTLDELVSGTLVAVQPLPQFDRIPARSGVVLDAWGTMTLVWFWGLGQPVPGESVFAIFPREITVLNTTLETMPLGSFESIARGMEAVQARSWWPSEMNPLIDRVAQVATERHAAQLAAQGH